MVAAAKLHEQMRAWLHSNRRAHQTARLHSLLRAVSLQHDERRFAIPPTLQVLGRPRSPPADGLHAVTYVLLGLAQDHFCLTGTEITGTACFSLYIGNREFFTCGEKGRCKFSSVADQTLQI